MKLNNCTGPFTSNNSSILGASSDLKQATSIALHMVKDWGMSEKVGLRTIEESKGLMANETLSANTIDAVSLQRLQTFSIILIFQSCVG